MARMPGATWLGEHAPVQSNGQRLRMTRYDAVCVHTIVGRAPAHAAHLSVRGNGEILQSRDSAYRSGANLDGNHRIIAVENEDHGSAFGSWNVNDGHAVPALTAAQVEANAQILAWAHRTHGVPLQLCPDSRPTSRGLAYHRQGIDGNFADYDYPGRVSGGEVWTTSRGKVCPGDRRIAQRPAILARAKQIVAGGTPTPTEPEDDMTPEQWETLQRVDKNLISSMKMSVSDRSLIPANTRILVGRELTSVRAALAELTGREVADVDEAQIARELAPILLPAIAAELGDFTSEQVEAALRRVLGSLDES